jgi:hypothetical protein
VLQSREIPPTSEFPVFDLNPYEQNIAQFSFPFINTEYEYRDIKVVLRGRLSDDSWAIVDEPWCYQPRGRRWAYERLPSSRTNKFLKASRMPLAEALPLAEKLARSKARQWEKRLVRMAARQEAVAAKRAQETSE